MADIGTWVARSGRATSAAWRYAALTVAARRGRFRHSPYARSGLMHLLGSLVWVYRPQTIVQLGLGEGLSAIVMALVARIRDPAVRLTGYDSFAGRSVGAAVQRSALEANLRRYGVAGAVMIVEADVLTAPPPEVPVGLLNVDIDNTYEKLAALRDGGWFRAAAPDGLVVIEGGYSRHVGREGSRGVMQFARELQADGFETFTARRYPGCILARRVVGDELDY